MNDKRGLGYQSGEPGSAVNRPSAPASSAAKGRLSESERADRGSAVDVAGEPRRTRSVSSDSESRSAAQKREKLRFEPEQGTTEGYGEEGGVRFYESSLAHAETGERLLTIVSVARGMRLTVAQARELHDWIGAWLNAA